MERNEQAREPPAGISFLQAKEKENKRKRKGREKPRRTQPGGKLEMPYEGEGDVANGGNIWRETSVYMRVITSFHTSVLRFKVSRVFMVVVGLLESFEVSSLVGAFSLLPF